MFSIAPHRRNLRTEQSPDYFVFCFCLRKPPADKSNDYRDAIVFEKLRFQNVFRPCTRERTAGVFKFQLKSFFEKLRFGDG